MRHEKLQSNEVAQMRGASGWLTALPLAEEQFVLSKRDSLALRYQWRLKRIPIYVFVQNLSRWPVP